MVKIKFENLEQSFCTGHTCMYFNVSILLKILYENQFLSENEYLNRVLETLLYILEMRWP